MILKVNYMVPNFSSFDGPDYKVEEIVLECEFPPKHTHGWMIVIQKVGEGRNRYHGFDMDRIVTYEFTTTQEEMQRALASGKVVEVADENGEEPEDYGPCDDPECEDCADPDEYPEDEPLDRRIARRIAPWLVVLGLAAGAAAFVKYLVT